MTAVVADVETTCWTGDCWLPYAGASSIFGVRAGLADNLNSESGWAFALLDALMWINQDYVCSDPYDQARGLLGLVDEEHTDQLGGFDDGPLEVVYARFTHGLLKNYPSPPDEYWWWIFSCATAPNKGEGFPSWVPDYSRQHPDHRGTYGQIKQHCDGFGKHVRASRRTTFPGLEEFVAYQDAFAYVSLKYAQDIGSDRRAIILNNMQD